jgi:hypothetical protein
MMEQEAKIKLGFVGGGPNSLIGHTHQTAASMLDQFELVGGVLDETLMLASLMPKSCNWLRSGFMLQ